MSWTGWSMLSSHCLVVTEWVCSSKNKSIFLKTKQILYSFSFGNGIEKISFILNTDQTSYFNSHGQKQKEKKILLLGRSKYIYISIWRKIMACISETPLCCIRLVMYHRRIIPNPLEVGLDTQALISLRTCQAERPWLNIYTRKITN